MIRERVRPVAEPRRPERRLRRDRDRLAVPPWSAGSTLRHPHKRRYHSPMRGRLSAQPRPLHQAAKAVVSAGSAGADTPRGRATEPAPVAYLGYEATTDSEGVWWRRPAQSDSRPTGGRCAESSTRRQTSSASRRSWLRPPHRVRSTTSRFRRSSRTRRCLGRTWPRASAPRPNFHAMAEIHFATWTRWVASNGATWHAAGRHCTSTDGGCRLRRRAGDTWVFNELTTAVREEPRMRVPTFASSCEASTKAMERGRPAGPSSSSASASARLTSPSTRPTFRTGSRTRPSGRT